MLPKSRIFSALLVGLGVALVVAGLLLPRFLQSGGKMPLDMENTTYTLYSTDAVVSGEPAEITRQLHLDVVEPSDAEMVNLRVGDSLFQDGTEFENLISASTWSWRADRDTGEPLTSATLSTVIGMPTVEVQMNGPWFNLPADNADTPIFDATLRDSVVATPEEDGELITYLQEIEPTNLATLYNDPMNTYTMVDDEGNTEQLYLTYRADRQLTYDANSGVLVGIEEEVDLYYADRQGRGVENVYTYTAATSEEQNQARIDELDNVASEDTASNIGLGMIIFGALLAVAAAIGALRGERR